MTYLKIALATLALSLTASAATITSQLENGLDATKLATEVKRLEGIKHQYDKNDISTVVVVFKNAVVTTGEYIQVETPSVRSNASNMAYDKDMAYVVAAAAKVGVAVVFAEGVDVDERDPASSGRATQQALKSAGLFRKP